MTHRRPSAIRCPCLLLTRSIAAFGLLILFNTTPSLATPEKRVPHTGSVSPYRGWDYLVAKLKADKVPASQLTAVFKNRNFPAFTFVPFAVAPRESSSIYEHFISPKNLVVAAAFARKHAPQFRLIERKLHVPRELVTAILFIESRLGEHTGTHMILYRLSRVASVRTPGNVEKNFLRLKETEPDVTLEQLFERSRYLEATFYKEVVALFEIARRNKIDPMNVRGSIAGAFGWPQFLPSTFLKFGHDGDGNGIVSLYNEIDAAWSVANYLSSMGYRSDLPYEKKRRIVWHYNHSDAYVDSVFDVARGILEMLDAEGRE